MSCQLLIAAKSELWLKSDVDFEFQKALNLPTFDVAGMTLLKRLTLIAKDGNIVSVHYPIFPSDSDAPWVIDYLHESCTAVRDWQAA